MMKREKKSWQELKDEIFKLKQELPDPVALPKIFITDTTPEGLQGQLAEQQGRAAVISDEGNIFEIMAGLYSNGKSNIDVFLQGHAGGSLRIQRAGRQVHLDMIAVTLGLAIQPQVLLDLKNRNQQSFRGKGIFARFLYGLPKSNIGQRDVRKRGSIARETKDAYASGIKRLLSATHQTHDKQTKNPLVLGLSNEALNAWEEFAQSIEYDQSEGGKLEHIQDWTGKLPGQALRISGLCHIASLVSPTEDALSSLSPLSHDRLIEISLKNIKPVIQLCQKLIIHAQAVFDMFEGDPNVDDAKWAFKWILSHIEKDDKGAFFFKQNTLHRSSKFKRSKLERLIKALDILRERHITSPQFKLKTKKPTYIYYVNPVLFEKAA